MPIGVFKCKKHIADRQNVCWASSVCVHLCVFMHVCVCIHVCVCVCFMCGREEVTSGNGCGYGRSIGCSINPDVRQTVGAVRK